MGGSESRRAAEDMVHSFGVPVNSTSMRQFILALELVHTDTDLLLRVTKGLYPEVASRYPKANWSSVERNLRSARDVILTRSDPKRLEEVFGHAFRYSFSVGDMLDHICFYMERKGLWPN